MRVLHHGAGDGDALLLAARQRAGALQRGLGDVEPLERGDRHRRVPRRVKRPSRLSSGGAVVEAAEQDIGQHVEARHQVELLEDHGAVALPGAQAAAASAPRPRCRSKWIVPSRGIDQPVDHAQQRRFAGAGAADDADHLPFGHSDRDVVDGGIAPESPGYVFQPQHALTPHAIRARFRLGLETSRECAMSVQ